MQRREPRNEQGQAPTSGVEDTAARLHEKADADRGRANRERIEQKIDENQEQKEKAMAKDPICGMDVDQANPPGGSSDCKGTTYYFCSADCKKTFDSDPAKFAAKA